MKDFSLFSTKELKRRIENREFDLLEARDRLRKLSNLEGILLRKINDMQSELRQRAKENKI